MLNCKPDVLLFSLLHLHEDVGLELHPQQHPEQLHRLQDHLHGVREELGSCRDSSRTSEAEKTLAPHRGGTSTSSSLHFSHGDHPDLLLLHHVRMRFAVWTQTKIHKRTLEISVSRCWTKRQISFNSSSKIGNFFLFWSQMSFIKTSVLN